MSDPQWAGCYTLHLYCKHGPHFSDPAEYTGTSESDCKRQAHREGWRLNPKERTATCPECNSKALEVDDE